ncbi:MAG: hypothetical protein WKF87_08785 [Chryseolinea sp.]
MHRLLFFVVAPFLLAACNDEIPAPSADVASFVGQIEGQWVSSEISILPPSTKKQNITIFPLANYSCNEIASVFKKKDVVSKFTIAVKGTYICVKKTYTCTLPPEQISWLIEPVDVDERSTMMGKDFLITEINEGVVQAKYTVLFFNNDPSDKNATSNANELWLQVTHDSNDASDIFIVKLKKVQS